MHDTHIVHTLHHVFVILDALMIYPRALSVAVGVLPTVANLKR